MATTTVSSKFQVVLPKAVRQLYDLKPGQVLQLICLPDRIELLPLQAASALRGFLKGANSFEREPDRL
ncbi:AbrB/MazE/SpoVT family DNA-binding domain-containing protein [Synechococcus sp. CS-602]|uniref:AbrB/MazE/SpoVT family DNA-binding domain-containing protein n=1 Tax=Synechococcaceae TaxID=1890426 RepID=UPI0008FF3200|nr:MULTISPECIES: AbrB/MazE/SpoVT family DNA-binding domain-containing protein [Synechococcaceae]MCT4365828.1 AbrB/MazE/SpoVT family DNA-binding domain-containing protein [Candidatus Regnicoccus frigidus MAG-AL1]APD48087.1 AbrB family transcriptional regulator [Synechococcus sp. SynAce01]MCT0203293.1 AbrB/MazE/SpoVT family DNA-binding domain-containing protein [Synechococcus sp. CS-603]MCT0203941.1 AbrB/MazE/SpoVT family DNA-binding domain-containing protein [Synechococcus sp. CS-602]MCT0246513